MKSKGFFKYLMKPFLSASTSSSREDNLEKIAAKEQKQFSFDILAKATNNFDHRRKLGEGGFGPVYRGKLDDGREIAVKMLSQCSRQGKREFKNEAQLLVRVQHRNVVSLLGYCIRGEDRLLVYEYVPNESLDKLLFRDRRDQIDWKTRFGIISGVAKGLQYLHEDAHYRIIHRDIKAANILLDEKWVPKVADFGMARLFPEDQTHVNTRIAGTNGYMAPEYVRHGHLTIKADVYSFGVVMLEIVSGRRSSSFELSPDGGSLLNWAYKLYKKGRSLEIMDPVLRPTAVEEQVFLCVQIGLLCTQSDPSLRPEMRRVTILLSKKPSSLEEPSRPGFTGTRYGRLRRPGTGSSSSKAGTSGSSSTLRSESTTSTYTNTATSKATATASTVGSPRLSVNDRGKRPMHS